MTYYLWDQADTIFIEEWDAQATGVPDYDSYIESLGLDPHAQSRRAYQWAYEKPYRDGLLKVDPAPGFIELLSWTKHNGAFTTGNREQREWRAEQLQKRFGFNLLDYIHEVFSTFDYGDTDVKTATMYEDVIRKIHYRGFDTIVYADDKIKNCEMFEQAAKKVPGIQYRLYRVSSALAEPAKSGTITEVRNLFDILDAEQALDN